MGTFFPSPFDVRIQREEVPDRFHVTMEWPGGEKSFNTISRPDVEQVVRTLQETANILLREAEVNGTLIWKLDAV